MPCFGLSDAMCSAVSCQPSNRHDDVARRVQPQRLGQWPVVAAGMDGVSEERDCAVSMALADRHQYARLVPAKRRDVDADLAAGVGFVVRECLLQPFAQRGPLAVNLVPGQVGLAGRLVGGAAYGGYIQCAGAVFDMAAAAHRVSAVVKFAVQPVDQFIRKLVVMLVYGPALDLELGAGAGEYARACKQHLLR